MRIDIAADSTLAALGVFLPFGPTSAPCTRVAQIAVQRLAEGSTAVMLNYDPNRVALDPAVPPDPYAPNVARCTGGVNAPAVAAYASSVHPGLVRALDSVGKNLFGSAVISAANPSDTIRIDIAGDSLVAATLSVFAPGAPCTRVAQLDVLRSPAGEPPITLRVDPTRVTPIPTSPPDPYVPNVARCTGGVT